ncbi:MAG: prepilin-type N-terminal cleavage/methylation domain-containing protein [Pseudomonadota bacterium]
MRSSRTNASCRNGFTLLEIVVSLAVVSLILGVVISRMDTMLEWDMKKASNKLASTMRYLYNKAASEGLYIRLVLDIDENAYWVEATTDPFVISTGEEGEKSAKQTKKTEGEQGAETKGLEGLTEEEEGYGLKPSEPVFTPVESHLLKPTKLPDTVFFKDVYVEHRRTGVDAGKESIYFFPNGYVEHAVINLRNDDDDINYSLETNPVSGRVNIEDRYRTREEQ